MKDTISGALTQVLTTEMSKQRADPLFESTHE